MLHRRVIVPVALRALIAGCLALAVVPGLAATAHADHRSAPEAAAVAAKVVDPVLVDRAAAAGLLRTERTWSTDALDYDNDGLDDILTVFHQWTDTYLYRNDGDGTFTNTFKIPRVNAQRGVLDRHDCAAYDVDGNGLLDIYCSGGRNQSNYVKTAEKDNELWLQLAPGQFTDRGTEWGVGDACGRGRMVAWVDVDNDGWKDLVVGNQAERSDPKDPCNVAANGYLPEGTKVYLNDHGAGLTYAAAWSSFRPNMGSRCLVPVDYNHDGRMDLIGCTFRNNVALAYRNTGSGFVDATSSLNLGKVADAAVADLNGDGVADLVLADVNGATYRRGTATGFASAVRIFTAPGSADGFALAIGDVQGDGLPDIYVLTDSTTSKTNPPDRLLVNHGAFSFVALTPPNTTSGMGDDVAAVDVTGNGVDQFLVLNGADTNNGPVQLIAAAP
ncbi:MAG: VCBS repeat-containing protein [Nocardioidaceae bacterium]|nr:VCBS repeat-containing protein [Nocardioidaceae bacterium]